MTKKCERRLYKDRKGYAPELLRDIANIMTKLKTDQTIGKAMTGNLKGWRTVRIMRFPYRLVFGVRNRPYPIVIVYAIGHRKNIYKNLARFRSDLDEQSKHNAR